jgi:hypothetical protein
MYVVAAYPAKVEIKKVTDKIRAGKIKIAEVTITPTGEPIKLEKLPINVSISGAATFNTSNSKITAENSSLDVVGTSEIVNAEKGKEVTVVFNPTVTITKEETFSIWASHITGITGTDNKDDKLTTKLGNKDNFRFTDIEGYESDIHGAKLLKENYDESSVEISY